MSKEAEEFANEAPGVHSAEVVNLGEFVHVYRGELSTAEQVRLLTLAPDVTDRAVRDAFTQVAGQWHNPSTHPNIVTVHDRGTTPRPWLAVEDVDGQPLDVAQSDLSLSEAGAIVDQIAEAIRKAHLYNATHLNLAPQHVWIVPEGGEQTALVDDWGLERACRVAAGECPLTPFTPPELVSNPDSYTEQADVYGLGAVAYYALTGRAPIADSIDEGLEIALTSGDITPPSDHEPALPAAVDETLRKALSRDSADRHESTYAFQTAFGNALPADIDERGAGGDEADTGAVESDATTADDSRDDPTDSTDSEGRSASPDTGQERSQTRDTGRRTRARESESTGGISHSAKTAGQGSPPFQESNDGTIRSHINRRTALVTAGLGVVGIGGWLSLQSQQTPRSQSDPGGESASGAATTSTDEAGTPDGSDTATPTASDSDQSGSESDEESASPTVQETDSSSQLVRSFDVTNPSERELQITIAAERELDGMAVSIDGDNRSLLDRSDFTETQEDGQTIYRTTYSGDTFGRYEATLLNITTAGETTTKTLSETLQLDPGPLEIESFDLSNDHLNLMEVTVTATNPLRQLSVTLNNRDSDESVTFTRDDFEEQVNENTYTYIAKTEVTSFGTYRASLETAIDVVGNSFDGLYSDDVRYNGSV